MSNKYLVGSEMVGWLSGEAYDITFIVTEECNLRCKYCYQVNKNNKNTMSFETAKKTVDYIVENRDIFDTRAVVWNFIGGEPLLEIELIDRIVEYIKLKTYKENHPWFDLYRINICSNGILYDDLKVQKFINKNILKLNMGISIDGIKEKHDEQRVYKDGRGSYEDVVKRIPLWIKQYPDAVTKVTIGSTDLKYVKDSIIHLWDLGIKSVPANVVFEDVWNEGDEVIFEDQLKELADYIIDNKLWNKYNTTLFSDTLGGYNTKECLERNNCGAGIMLAIDANGNFYPCLRYASYCLESKPAYIIGNINTGIDFDKVRPFIGLNCKMQSDQECIDCEIAQGCGWCQGYNYDSSDIGTNYQRAKFICKMHKARYKANEYYWNKLREVHEVERTEKVKRKKHLFFIMDDNCVEHCNYDSYESGVSMSAAILEAGIKFCEDEFFKPVILNSKNNKNIKKINEISYIDRLEIYDSNTAVCNNNVQKIQVYCENGSIDNITTDICILNIEDISKLYETTKRLFEKCSRINLSLKLNSKDFDINKYEEELEKVAGLILEYYKKSEVKEFNRLTDIINLENMDNCDFGVNNYALAPNGKIYTCPKFYFNNPEDYIGDIYDGIKLNNKKMFTLSNSPICKECDILHCERCTFLNKKFTNEYNTPSAIQCKVGMVERKVSNNIISKISGDKHNGSIVNAHENPINRVLEKQNVNPYNMKAFID